MRRQYPFQLIEAKWQRFWDAQATFRAWNPRDEIPAEHPFARRHGLAGRPGRESCRPSITYLTCFPIPPAPACTSAIRKATPPRTSWPATAAPWGSTSCARWAGMPSACPPSNTPSAPASIRGRPPKPTSPSSSARSNRSASATIGAANLTPPTPAISNGRSGFFCSFTIRGSIRRPTRPSRLRRCPIRPAHPSPEARRLHRDNHRLAYVTEAPVWWCEQLGTVLANEEVVDGKSEVGGFPVVRKPMRQWMLRITAYAERLLEGLEHIEWSESLKEMQRNWIGRSEGAEVEFPIADCGLPIADSKIRVFTTRPDTLVWRDLHGALAGTQIGRVHHHAGTKEGRGRLQGLCRRQVRS
jgi:hypothetical protein